MAKITNVFQKGEIKKETHPKRITKWIHYTKLKSNKYQYCEPRDKEEIECLADLIQADGEVLQDLLIRKIDADEYVIIAGHKRRAACKLLAEERGMKQFEFLPCIEKNISDVKAEFQVYSSNGHHVETAYETMHKLERMQYLLNHYPEEFPDIQKGRMVERLARQFRLSKTTVGEYQKISKNLGDKAMEAFKNGKVEKSAAVTLAGMTEEEQEVVLDKGITTDKELKKYKKENLEPSANQILKSYTFLQVEKYDCPNRKVTIQKLADAYGKGHAGIHNSEIDIVCTPLTISLDGREITWKRYGRLLDDIIPPYRLEEQAIRNNPAREPCFGTRRVQIPEKVYHAILSQEQRFLIVKTGEGYQRGQMLELWTMENGVEKGSELRVMVTDILSSENEPGLKDGYSLLSLSELFTGLEL